MITMKQLKDRLKELQKPIKAEIYGDLDMEAIFILKIILMAKKSEIEHLIKIYDKGEK